MMNKILAVIAFCSLLCCNLSWGQTDSCTSVEVAALKFFVDSIYMTSKYDLSKYKIKYSIEVRDEPVLSDLKRNHCFKESKLVGLIVLETLNYKKSFCSGSLDKRLFQKLNALKASSKKKYCLSVYRRLKVEDQFIVSIVLVHKFGEIRFDLLLDGNLNVIDYCNSSFNI